MPFSQYIIINYLLVVRFNKYSTNKECETSWLTSPTFTWHFNCLNNVVSKMYCPCVHINHHHQIMRKLQYVIKITEGNICLRLATGDCFDYGYVYNITCISVLQYYNHR